MRGGVITLQFDVKVQECDQSLKCEFAEKITIEGDKKLVPLTITENGTYEGGIEDGKQVGYNPVTVEVKQDKSLGVKAIIEARGGNAYFLFGSEYFNNGIILTTELAEELISYDTFENATSLKCAFQYCRKITTIPLSNTSKVISLADTWYCCDMLKTLPLFDTSSVTNMDSVCGQACSMVEVPLWNTRNVQSANYAFLNCKNIVEFPAWDLRSCARAVGIFLDMPKCKAFWIRNLIVGIDFHYSWQMTKESAIHLLYECRDTGSAKTITFSKETGKLLADVYVKSIPITDEMRAEDDLVDEKLPFVVCEPTDEGATLITEYVLQKNWQVAFA